MNKISVMHIDTDRQWRGGQQQGFYLHKKLLEKDISSVFLCQPGSLLNEKLESENLLYLTMKINGEADFLAGKKIAGICREKNINILHLHDAHAMATGLWAKVFNPSLLLVGVRRVDYPIKKNIFSQYKYKSAKMTKIVAISDEIKRILIKDGIDESKIEVIKSGVDIDKFSNIEKSLYLNEKLNLPDNAFIAGTVAALAGHKDYPTLLRAFQIAAGKIPNLYFVSIGDGPDRDAIFRLRDELGLKDRFILRGFQKDVGNHLKNYDVFVLSSKTEGLGTSVMDAMAAGLPCICCKSGGIPELIDDGVNGLLVEKENPVFLADKIIEVFTEEKLRIELGKAAREKSSQFSIDKTVDENIELYKNLVS
ncbi:MAG: glycosyltransferase [Desulfobacteraceae bacterium]|nr:glycosyltransferase [Desulfobacteraceae bacterium]